MSCENTFCHWQHLGKGSLRHILRAELSPGTGWVPSAPLFCGCSAMKSSPPSLVLSRLRFWAQECCPWVCARACPDTHEGNSPLEWLSLGTQEAAERWFCEGGLSPMACCTLALGSRVGLELKAQGRALLQSSPGEWCRSSSCQPNLTVNPQTLGHGSAQGQDCTGSVQGGWSLLGASSWAPEGTQTPPEWGTPGDSTAQPKELH